MKLLPTNKKGGIVGDIVQGTGGLIILTIIVLVIVSTILGANLLSDNKRTVLENTETITAVNITGSTFGQDQYLDSVCSIVVATNVTDVIHSGNYTITGADCTVAFTGDDTSAAFYNNSVWVINSSTSYASSSKVSSNGMNTNFTAGIDNVSEKIPTILLIAAVVLLFGVLVLLVAKSRQMGIGGGTSL